MDKITVPSLMTKLRQVTDWYMLGVYLELPSHELDKIRHQFHSDGVERCKAALFDLWTRSSLNVSWEVISSALRKCGETVLAERVVKCTQQSNCSTAATCNSPLQQPCTSTKLITVGEERVDEFTEIEDSFAILVTNIKAAIEDKQVSLKELQRFLEERLEQSLGHKQETTIDELFQQIRPHYCFFNTSLLKSIVSKFLGEPMLLKLADYNKRVQIFSHTTKLAILKQCPLLENLTTSLAAECTPQVVLKLAGYYLPITIRHFQKLVNRIFKAHSNVLTLFRVEDGCICVKWCACLSALPLLVSLAEQNTRFMRLVGVLALSVGDTVLLEKLNEDESEDDLDSFVAAVLKAAAAGCTEAIEFLVSIDPDYKQGNECPLLCVACMKGSFMTVKILLEANVNPNLSDSHGFTPLMLASLSGHSDIVDLLVCFGADVDSRANNGQTALQLCVKYNVRDLVLFQSLIAAGANVNLMYDDGWSILMIFCTERQNELVTMLLQSAADPNVQGFRGETALMISAQQQDAVSIYSLLAAGADPNLCNEYGWTALMCSCSTKLLPFAPEYAVPSLLISAGADANRQSVYGCTALMIAAHNGYKLGVKLLLDANVDVNVQDVKGNTALDYAIKSNSYTVVQLILSAGASITKNN